MISRRRAAQILLYLSAVLILVGGLYDLLTSSPPPHHLAFLGVSAQELDPRTASLLSALLRALGGALIGVGIGSAYLDQPRGLPGPQVGHRGSGADGRADRGSKRRADAQRGFALLGPTNVHRLDDYRCGIGPRAHKHLSNHVPDFSDEPVGRSAEVRWKTSGGK